MVVGDPRGDRLMPTQILQFHHPVRTAQVDDLDGKLALIPENILDQCETKIQFR